MLLRIFLIIAILAGVGVIAISHFKVKPHIEGIIEQREKNAKDRDMEKAAKVKAQTELKATAAKLKDTESTLGETQTQLTATKGQLDTTQKQLASTKKDLDTRTSDLHETQQKLARWDGIPLDPSQVKELIISEKKFRDNNEVLKAEMQILVKANARLTNQLAQLISPGDEPPMKQGLRGKVLVVDPKWNFVVLDVGENAGAVQNGVLMISRNSKLVAKVRIMTLQSERSIANIMPGWRLGEVMEGDQAIY